MHFTRLAFPAVVICGQPVVVSCMVVPPHHYELDRRAFSDDLELVTNSLQADNFSFTRCNSTRNALE